MLFSTLLRERWSLRTQLTWYRLSFTNLNRMVIHEDSCFLISCDSMQELQGIQLMDCRNVLRKRDVDSLFQKHHKSVWRTQLPQSIGTQLNVLAIGNQCRV